MRELGGGVRRPTIASSSWWEIVVRSVCFAITIVVVASRPGLASHPDVDAIVEARNHEIAQATWRAAGEAAEDRDFSRLASALEFIVWWGSSHLQEQATRNLPFVRCLIERPDDVTTRIRFAQEFWGFVTPSPGLGSLAAREFLLETLPLASTIREASVVRAHILMYALAAEALELAEHDVDRIVSASGVDSWDAAQARESLARALLAAGRCERAVALLRETIESPATAEEVATSRMLLAEAYEKLGDMKRMVEQWEFVLFSAGARSHVGYMTKSLAAERLGDYFLRNGDPGRALTYFTAWVPAGECGTCVELASKWKTQRVGACREAMSRRSNAPTLAIPRQISDGS
jgi:hypothetical protein